MKDCEDISIISLKTISCLHFEYETLWGHQHRLHGENKLFPFWACNIMRISALSLWRQSPVPFLTMKHCENICIISNEAISCLHFTQETGCKDVSALSLHLQRQPILVSETEFGYMHHEKAQESQHCLHEQPAALHLHTRKCTRNYNIIFTKRFAFSSSSQNRPRIIGKNARS